LLRTFRNFEIPELNAFHRSVELKCPGFRIGRHETQRLMSDYGLLNRATPFVHRLDLSAVSIVLEGEARFEEGSRRIFVREGTLVAADQLNQPTEAYAPTERATKSAFLFVDWDPKIFGGGGIKRFEGVRLKELDRARLAICAHDLVREEAPESERVVELAAEILSILRACGLPMTNVTAKELGDHASRTTTKEDQRLLTALDKRLSNIELHPSLDEVADDLGWSDRHTTRRIGDLVEAKAIAWPQWKTCTKAVRLMNAFRVLSLPEGTTELAAKKAGFRSPAALCHAFAKANLPSPGVLAKACHRGVLDAWTSLVNPTQMVA